jgi:hypothetical protein
MYEGEAVWADNRDGDVVRNGRLATRLSSGSLLLDIIMPTMPDCIEAEMSQWWAPDITIVLQVPD